VAGTQQLTYYALGERSCRARRWPPVSSAPGAGSWRGQHDSKWVVASPLCVERFYIGLKLQAKTT